MGFHYGYGNNFTLALDGALYAMIYEGYKILNLEVRYFKSTGGLYHYYVFLDGIGWCVSSTTMMNDVYQVRFIVLNQKNWVWSTDFQRYYLQKI